MDAARLVRQLLPHAPQHGLYLAPDIPRPKLDGALGDYARGTTRPEVLALYDNTRLGSAKDGAVFLADRLVFQNSDLRPPQTIRYEDVVDVHVRRQLLGGRTLRVDVNRARATVTEEVDFSAHAGAAEYVERFLREVMAAAALRPPLAEPPPDDGATDREAVRSALARLRAEGRLSRSDYARLLTALGDD